MTFLLTSLYLAIALKVWSSDWSLESLLVGLIWPGLVAVLLVSPGLGLEDIK